MSKTTAIQWTDATWNIARGCTKVDEDCKFCYMYRDSFDSTRYNPLQVVKTKTVFNTPLKLKEPSKIFTCSLTDFFHEGCDSFRNEAWDIIRKCPQHTFQILTKRPTPEAKKAMLYYANKMKYQFDRTGVLNYGDCALLLKPVCFIPNTCQIDTQQCFENRRVQ